MKISKVQAQLSSNDILSIINEFAKVDGLSIDKADIYGNEIEIGGSFKKGVAFDFKGAIALEGVIDGKIHARFSKLKILKLGIFRVMRNFALKKAIQALDIKGIEIQKDKIIIDLEKLLLDVPYVDLRPSDLYIKNGVLFAEIEKIEISLVGGIIKEKPVEKKETIKDEIEYPINKVEDCYTSGRNKLEEKMPEGLKKEKNIIFIIPDIVALIYRLLKDKRVSVKTKLYLSAAVAYITFPIDFIPDSVPLIGKIDDIGVAVFALNKIIVDVPIQVIAENWEGNIDLLSVLKNALEYLINFTNAKNVEKLYNIIEELSTL